MQPRTLENKIIQSSCPHATSLSIGPYPTSTHQLVCLRKKFQTIYTYFVWNKISTKYGWFYIHPYSFRKACTYIKPNDM